jgi:hypothetical protein
LAGEYASLRPGSQPVGDPEDQRPGIVGLGDDLGHLEAQDVAAERLVRHWGTLPPS